MSDDLFKEVLLHGNLEVAYTLREIKKFNIREFFNIIKDFKLGNGGIYRFFVNYKIFLTVKEFELIKENKPDAVYLLDIIKVIISKADELNVFENLEIRINTCDYNSIIKVFIYNLLHTLEYKIKSYILENQDVNDFHKKFCEYFRKFIPTFRTEYLIVDHVTPFETNNYWKPHWKINYKNEDYSLEGVDTFIDINFNRHLITCHSEVMFLELRYIKDRISYLKRNTGEYYFNYIRDLVEPLTKNIFENFPLQIIYRDYYDCMREHSEFYRPELSKFIKLEDFTRDIYILSILPLYLSAYLVGFAILRADVPSYKNIAAKIKDFDMGYFDRLADHNRKYLEIIAMGVNCGNSQNEAGDFLDVYYNRVIDFNVDDICQVFNNGVYHLFVGSEFNDLSKKGNNFYNRSELKIMDPIIYNLRFKRKTKRLLGDRGIKVELNSTLKENFLEIKNAIKNQEITRNEDVVDRRVNFIGDTIINFLMV